MQQRVTEVPRLRSEVMLAFAFQRRGPRGFSALRLVLALAANDSVRNVSKSFQNRCESSARVRLYHLYGLV